MKQKIYIAGKVTGEPINEAALKFALAKNKVDALGFEPVNPIEVVNNPKAEWDVAMRLCIAALMQCDAILLLPCFIGSKGALIESELASRVNIPVFFNLKEFNLN